MKIDKVEHSMEAYIYDLKNNIRVGETVEDEVQNWGSYEIVFTHDCMIKDCIHIFSDGVEKVRRTMGYTMEPGVKFDIQVPAEKFDVLDKINLTFV